MTRTTLAALLALASPHVASAGEMTLGPLEIGVTECDAVAGLADPDVELEMDLDYWSGGVMHIFGPGAFGQGYTEKVQVSCDWRGEHVEAIFMWVPPLEANTALRALEAAHTEIDRTPVDRGKGRAIYFSPTAQSLAVFNHAPEGEDASTLVLMSRYYLNLTNGGEAFALNPDPDPKEVSLGPIEIGVTPCEEALALTRRTGVQRETGTSEVTGGRWAAMGAAPFGVAHVQEAELHCDAGDAYVDAIHITVAQDDFRDVFEELDRNYRRLRLDAFTSGDMISAHCSDTHESCASMINKASEPTFGIMLATMNHAKRGVAKNGEGKSEGGGG